LLFLLHLFLLLLPLSLFLLIPFNRFAFIIFISAFTATSERFRVE
jgi:hypothetical protein